MTPFVKTFDQIVKDMCDHFIGTGITTEVGSTARKIIDVVAVEIAELYVREDLRHHILEKEKEEKDKDFRRIEL